MGKYLAAVEDGHLLNILQEQGLYQVTSLVAGKAVVSTCMPARLALSDSYQDGVHGASVCLYMHHHFSRTTSWKGRRA
jgi:hypothetical protein